MSNGVIYAFGSQSVQRDPVNYYRSEMGVINYVRVDSSMHSRTYPQTEESLKSSCRTHQDHRAGKLGFDQFDDPHRLSLPAIR